MDSTFQGLFTWASNLSFDYLMWILFVSIVKLLILLWLNCLLILEYGRNNLIDTTTQKYYTNVKSITYFEGKLTIFDQNYGYYTLKHNSWIVTM